LIRRDRKYSVRAIAFYLPQFHPIPENDEWWGRGFTEWTNVAKAKPPFRGHYQPHVPADLGFYDLRVPETRIAQAEMAREYGIEAFCYYHYWFAGKRLLERPFAEVLQSGKPDFPFCLCWANHTWTDIWAGSLGRTLIEQSYPGEADHRANFDTLLHAFSDDRYLKVDEKPLFLIYKPMEIPDINRVTDLWRSMAVASGLKGLHLVGAAWEEDWIPQKHGFDGSVPKDNLPRRLSWQRPVKRLIHAYEKRVRKLIVYSYEDFVSDIIKENKINSRSYPCILPNWDNTPRAGRNGFVLHGSSPELFRTLVRRAIEVVQGFPMEQRLILVKSWNEWAEGNHLEPDLKFGKKYLQTLKEEIESAQDGLSSDNIHPVPPK
jgi:lipopolysaccharide biosynthesis protein